MARTNRKRYVEPTQGEKIAEDKESLEIKLEYREKEKFAVGGEIKEILYVVNEKIISKAEFGSINPKNIESVNVLKHKEDFKQYSSGDYDGAIIITLKKRAE